MSRLRVLALAAVPSALALSLGAFGVATAGAPVVEQGAGRPVGAKSPSALAGTTVIGQVATNTTGLCGPNSASKMNTVNGATSSYTVPSNGVLTSFSYNSGTHPGGVALLLLKPTAVPSQYDVAARSGVQAVVASALNTYPVRIPVQAGWQVGSVVTANLMNCVFAGVAGDEVGYGTFAAATDQQLNVAGGVAGRANIAAVLEPDADLDGFGDASQDLCPQSAATQAACPAPATVITKAPAKKTTKRKVTLAFTSVPGATYTCAVDGAAAAPCRSPFRKRLSVGKHVVVVTATSAAGISDPTPPSARFKIVRRR
jgi:hypothetical protein